MSRKKMMLVLIPFLVAASAQAELKVVPAKSEDPAVTAQAMGTPPATNRAPDNRMKPDNFGKTVSAEAKVFRKEPIPGYRNFGQWVSSQRRHAKNQRTPGGDVTPGGTQVKSGGGTNSSGTHTGGSATPTTGTGTGTAPTATTGSGSGSLGT